MENMPETLTFDSEIKIPDLEVEKSQNGGDEHDRSLAMEVGHSIRDIHSNWRGRDFGNEPSCRQNEEKQIWEKTLSGRDIPFTSSILGSDNNDKGKYSVFPLVLDLRDSRSLNLWDI